MAIAANINASGTVGVPGGYPLTLSVQHGGGIPTLEMVVPRDVATIAIVASLKLGTTPTGTTTAASENYYLGTATAHVALFHTPATGTSADRAEVADARQAVTLGDSETTIAITPDWSELDPDGTRRAIAYVLSFWISGLLGTNYVAISSITVS